MGIEQTISQEAAKLDVVWKKERAERQRHHVDVTKAISTLWDRLSKQARKDSAAARNLALEQFITERVAFVTNKLADERSTREHMLHDEQLARTALQNEVAVVLERLALLTKRL